MIAHSVQRVPRFLGGKRFTVIVISLIFPLGLIEAREAPQDERADVFFCRMFWKSDTQTADAETKLTALGRSMLQKTGDVPKGCGPRDNVPAGYTYFGQLIDHDLVFDPIKLDDVGKDVEAVRNGRTPRLDLDQIYGGGPAKSPDLYCGPTDAERFKIAGKADLPLGRGRKLLGDPEDPRDLENLMVLQMHVLFMKLHNIAVEQCMEPGLKEVGPENGTRFARARRLVTWQYQWLVLNDYLPRIAPATHSRTDSTLVSRDGSFAIPIEFAAAAFRFGHSMVRKGYVINGSHRDGRFLNLRELMAQGRLEAALEDIDIIDWAHFFRVGSEPAPSEPIDTRIVPDLGDLKPATTRLFIPQSSLKSERADASGEIAELSVRTLLRGSRNRIPSGQEIAKAVGGTVLCSKELDGSSSSKDGRPDKSGRVLREQELLQATPLFYYILREAEIAPNCGEHIGPVGSYIVRETLYGAIESDADSYANDLAAGPDWKTPLWKFSTGPRQIKFMNDLVELAGR